MDTVYDVSGFRASNNINVAEYFKKYSEICPPAKRTVIENFLHFTEDIDLFEIGVDFGILEATCKNLKGESFY
ncbi:unnamed protein product [Psylliodes chrysocephalus]|uniref:Uncharacterized protein n=1 Tax=Psylliodes chrysocephalus TaxID=3402493 RepID=A0A9P0GJM1_9CUCU|nr:unnamed protein product [Psylliodes chrysocephala]